MEQENRWPRAETPEEDADIAYLDAARFCLRVRSRRPKGVPCGRPENIREAANISKSFFVIKHHYTPDYSTRLSVNSLIRHVMEGDERAIKT